MAEERVLGRFWDLFGRFSTKAFERLEGDPQYSPYEQLYHYTPLAGLEGMISSESLRATSIYMMNDPNELSFGHST